MGDSLRDLLRDPDPAQRKHAVMRLARSTDQRAVQILTHLHQHDPDAAIRKLAAQAIAYRQQQAKPVFTPPEPQPEPASASSISPDDILKVLDLPAQPAAQPVAPLSPLKRPTTTIAPPSLRHRRGAYTRNLLVFSLLCVLVGAGILYVTVGDVIRRAYYMNGVNEQIREADAFPFGAAPVGIRLNGEFYTGRISDHMTYYIQEPSGIAPVAGWPIIVGVHGSNGNGRDAFNWIGYEARSQNAIFVAPTFSQNPDGSFAYTPSARDLNILLTELERYYPIDQRAKIIFGFSGGGMFASSYTAEFRYFTGASIGGSPFFFEPPLTSPVHFVVVCGDLDPRLEASRGFAVAMANRGTPVWHYEAVAGAAHVMTTAQIDATFDLLDYLTSR